MIPNYRDKLQWVASGFCEFVCEDGIVGGRKIVSEFEGETVIEGHPVVEEGQRLCIDGVVYRTEFL